MKLPARLEYIFSLCKKSIHTVDVGTDHGKLAVALVISGKADFVTASDINEKPLEKARTLVSELALSDKVRIFLTDGLNGMEDSSPDQIIIAGMGGELIRDIMSAAQWIKNPNIRFILQPMTTAPELRRFLYEEGFTIECEGAVSEVDKVYEVLVVSYSGNRRKIDFITAELGGIKGRTPAEKALLLKKRASAEKRLIGAKRNSSEAASELENMILYINECLEVN